MLEFNISSEAKLHHTFALNIVLTTGCIRKVALWLGYESIQTTEDYLLKC